MMAGPVKKRTPAQEKKLQEKALQICESSRAQLLLKHPFVGRLGIQIPFVPVNDSRIHSIATNGKVIYFRPEWVCSMPPVTMMAIVGHTIWTAALCHSFRRGECAPGKFDAASDIEVYKLLQVEKVNMVRKPDFADLFPVHQPVEKIFEKLPDNVYRRSPDSDVHLYSAGVVSLPDLPGGTEKKEEKDEEQPPPPPPDPEGNDEAACVQQGNSSSGAEKGQKRNDPSSPGGTGDSSDEEHQEADCSCDPSMREVWRQRIIEAGQNYKLVYGELPAELAGLVEFFSEGKINYMQLLRRYLGRCSGGEASWLPPARRFVWQKQYLPSHRNPKLEIVVAVDTSGSIKKEDFQQFFGEIFAIVQSFPNYQLTVIQCDAAVQSVHRFSREKPFKKETPFEIKGGGGTRFMPVFACLAKEKITPRVLLYYTDGEGRFPSKAPRYPVIWCLTQESEVPWGKKILIPKK